MGIEDIPKAAKAAKIGKQLGKAVVIPYEGVRYKFPPGTDPIEAQQWIWKNVVGNQVRGSVEDIELPSELPKERVEALAEEKPIEMQTLAEEGAADSSLVRQLLKERGTWVHGEAPPKADVLPFKPKPAPQWDRNTGMGAVPNGMEGDFEYLQGFVRPMKPDEFLSHTPVVWAEPSVNKRYKSIVSGIEEGKPMAPPFLVARWDPENKNWYVQAHEGRHRSLVVRDMYGKDTDIPVQIMPRKEDGTKFREGELTDEMRKAPIVGVGAAAGVGLTQLKPDEEKQFQLEYAAYASMNNLDPNPDNPLHFYDYRAAWKAGKLKPSAGGHLPSKFKLEGHPRRYVDPKSDKASATPVDGYVDTVTGEIVGKPKAKKMEPGYYQRDDGTYFEVTDKGEIIEHGS